MNYNFKIHNPDFVRYLESQERLDAGSAQQYDGCLKRLLNMYSIDELLTEDIDKLARNYCANNFSKATGEPLGKKALKNYRGTIKRFVAFSQYALAAEQNRAQPEAA